MLEWAVKISCTAVLFTVISYVLPGGKLRKASLTTMSFIFLTLIMLPLKDVAADIINRKYILEKEKNSVINQVESGNINNQIIEEYKKRIADEIIRELEVNNFNCIKAFVSVDEKTDSEKFCNVLNVVCDMTVKRENEKENSVDSIKVPQIVIDKSGIRIESDTEKEEVDLSDEETIIAEIVANVTGVDKSRILIRWSDLK